MHSTRNSCQVIIKLEYSRQPFDKSTNIKFHKNPSNGSRVVPCGRADTTKLLVAFRNFANAPKKKYRDTKAHMHNEISSFIIAVPFGFHLVWSPKWVQYLFILKVCSYFFLALVPTSNLRSLILRSLDHTRIDTHTHTHTHTVRLLWMSDQLLAEACT
jgi:hypothetical protein